MVAKKLIKKTAFKKVKKVKKVEKEEVVKVSSKLIIEKVKVCKDENGNNGYLVEGIVDSDRKSVTTLAGVTYSV